MLNKIVLLPLFLALLLPLCMADPIDVSYKLKPADIYGGDLVLVEVSITNNQDSDDAFKVQWDPVSSVGNRFFKELSEPKQISIKSGQSGAIFMSTRITEDIEPQIRYTIPIWVKSLSKEEIKLQIPINVYISTPKDPIRITSNLPENALPGRTLGFTITMKNTINLIFDEVDIYVSSDLFSQKFTEKFYPFQDITKDIAVDIEPTIKPGTYTVGITAFKGKEMKGRLFREIVIGKNVAVQDTEDKETGFLTTKITLGKKNNGNTRVQ